jgi:hypothetical protein
MFLFCDPTILDILIFLVCFPEKPLIYLINEYLDFLEHPNNIKYKKFSFISRLSILPCMFSNTLNLGSPKAS